MEYDRADQKVLWVGVSHVHLRSNPDKCYVHVCKKAASLIAYESIGFRPTRYTNALAYGWCRAQK
jgi:hypothetical protein